MIPADQGIQNTPNLRKKALSGAVSNSRLADNSYLSNADTPSVYCGSMIKRLRALLMANCAVLMQGSNISHSIPAIGTCRAKSASRSHNCARGCFRVGIGGPQHYFGRKLSELQLQRSPQGSPKYLCACDVNDGLDRAKISRWSRCVY
jgi:hypothetical protein